MNVASPLAPDNPFGTYSQSQECRWLLIEVSPPRRLGRGDSLPRCYLVRRLETYFYDQYRKCGAGQLRLALTPAHRADEGLRTREWHASFNTLHQPGRVSVSCLDPFRTGSVNLDLPEVRGWRIGTFMLSEVIGWLQEHAPSSAVSTPVYLSRADATDDANRVARNRLWMNHGYRFSSDDPIEGSSAPIILGELRRVETWRENIRVVDLAEAIRSRHRIIEDCTSELRSTRHRLDQLSRAHRRWRAVNYTLGVGLLASVLLYCFA